MDWKRDGFFLSFFFSPLQTAGRPGEYFEQTLILLAP